MHPHGSDSSTKCGVRRGPAEMFKVERNSREMVDL